MHAAAAPLLPRCCPTQYSGRLARTSHPDMAGALLYNRDVAGARDTILM